MGKLEKIQGEVDSIIYKNEDNGYGVILLNCENDLVTVVGNMGDVEEGEDVVATGQYVHNAKFGEQFKAEMFERSLPKTEAAIQRYLASGAVSGIGPVLARKIVKQFGEDTLDVLENEPQKLTELCGVSSASAKKMSDSFKTTFAVRALMAYLNKYQISTEVGIRAWKQWGNESQQIIRNNPYSLCNDGIDLSFSKADEVASQENITSDSRFRIAAGISYVLRQNADSGHTCLPLDMLVKLSSGLLGVDKKLCEKTIDTEVSEENLFYFQKNKRTFVMLRQYYVAEDYIANRLAVMRQLTYDNKVDFSAVIDLEEENNDIKYEKVQREAINLALSKGFLVLTGGPGTGKTTTLNAIISLYQQQGLNVMITAPTGRAAKRISDLTGYDAKTIHRLLEVKFTSDERQMFIHDEDNQLDCEALIVDEMSMVDSCLFEALLRAISVTCKLVLVGDSDQLPSVGAGSVLHDIIDSGAMSVVRLKEIFRQSRESEIVMNAHKIVNGEHIDLTVKDKDFFFFQRLEYEGLQNLVVELCKKRLPEAYGFNPLEDIQVLSPTRKGPAGVVELNKRLQNELNPKAAGKSEVKGLLYTFRVGDKVMQTKNDYETEWKKTISDDKTEIGTGIYNGDIGYIKSANKILKTVVVDFDGRVAVYSGQLLENLELAYAVTVHKSQGSEFNVAIITVYGGFDKLYYRNLLYTAVTRAKKMLIIVGSKKRVDFMIDNDRRNLRYTALKNMLMNYVEGDNNEKEQEDLQISD